jgi:hypothetical protein
MGIPASICHHGILSADSPPSGCRDDSAENDTINTSFDVTSAASKSARITLTSVLVGSPLVLPMESVVKARVVVIRVRGGSVTVILTSAAGATQKFNVSSTFVWYSPNSGDEVTAIALAATSADVTYFIAGDAS